MRIAMVVMVDWVRVQPEFLFQNVVDIVEDMDGKISILQYAFAVYSVHALEHIVSK